MQATARSACCSTSTCLRRARRLIRRVSLLAGLGYVRAQRCRRVLRETDRFHREKRTSRCVSRVQGDLRAQRCELARSPAVRLRHGRLPRHAIDTIKDLRRTVDYLETRGDLDRNSIAFFGYSWGGVNGPATLAQEPRLRLAVIDIGLLPPMGATPEVVSGQCAAADSHSGADVQRRVQFVGAGG